MFIRSSAVGFLFHFLTKGDGASPRKPLGLHLPHPKGVCHTPSSPHQQHTADQRCCVCSSKLSFNGHPQQTIPAMNRLCWRFTFLQLKVISLHEARRSVAMGLTPRIEVRTPGFLFPALAEIQGMPSTRPNCLRAHTGSKHLAEAQHFWNHNLALHLSQSSWTRALCCLSKNAESLCKACKAPRLSLKKKNVA